MKKEDKKTFMLIYERLLSCYGPQGWWPVIPDHGSGEGSPLYTGGPVSARQRLEVALGAVLTQNTSWRGARTALENLYRAGLLEFKALRAADQEKLAQLVRPSGYFNQKARRIKTFVGFLYSRYGGRWEGFFDEPAGRMRELLLELNGIGPETADSIVLYAAGRPSFVIDAYTRRLFYRLGLEKADVSYGELKRRFESALPARTELYAEYHALIVRHSVERCKARKPLCTGCPLEELCPGRGALKYSQ